MWERADASSSLCLGFIEDVAQRSRGPDARTPLGLQCSSSVLVQIVSPRGISNSDNERPGDSGTGGKGRVA